MLSIVCVKKSFYTKQKNVKKIELKRFSFNLKYIERFKYKYKNVLKE